MKAAYQNEYDEGEPCVFPGHNLTGTKALISIDGERGRCSSHLVEEE